MHIKLFNIFLNYLIYNFKQNVFSICSAAVHIRQQLHGHAVAFVHAQMSSDQGRDRPHPPPEYRHVGHAVRCAGPRASHQGLGVALSMLPICIREQCNHGHVYRSRVAWKCVVYNAVSYFVYSFVYYFVYNLYKFVYILCIISD